MDVYAALICPLMRWDLANKKVFVRADLNVPIAAGVIQDDARLQAIRPTLDFILAQGGTIILATHIGNPHKVEEEFSVEPLRAWLRTEGYDERVTLLENLRFRAEEHASHPGAQQFAQELAQEADYYIDDAFASLHDANTSLTLLPKLFPPDKRGIGFLVSYELSVLSSIKYGAQQPYYFILGGGKAAKKLPFLASLLEDPRSLATDIMLCPAMSWPFWYLGQNKKKSHLTEDEQHLIQQAQSIIDLAKERAVKIHLPKDYLISKHGWDGPFVYKSAQEVTAEEMMIGIGPETVHAWTTRILNAGTIFFNGPMGTLEKPETVKELHAVLRLITQSNAISIVGGGNSCAALQFFNLTNAVTFCSTGGGATLAYLCNERLPALDALL